jgi:hypothetical protein
MLHKCLHTLTVRDIQRVEFYIGEPAIGFQGFGVFELFVFVEGLGCCFASAGVTCCEVDEEGAVVEGRCGVLEGELADWIVSVEYFPKKICDVYLWHSQFP